MKYLRKISLRVLANFKRVGKWIMNFCKKNKQPLLWIFVPSVIMIIWELFKWFKKLEVAEMQNNSNESNEK